MDLDGLKLFSQSSLEGVNRKPCINTLFHIFESNKLELKELRCAHNLSKQANSQLLEVVDDKKREKEEASEDAGSSISCRILGLGIGAFGHYIGALGGLVPVNVSLDGRALAGVKISDRRLDVLKDLAQLPILHLSHRLRCVALMLHQAVAAGLNSCHQVVACLSCPEGWPSIISFLHGVNIFLVGAPCALVECVLDISALVRLDNAN